MTYSEFYDKIAQLTLYAPTDEIADKALDLQVLLNDLNNLQYDDLFELFD